MKKLLIYLLLIATFESFVSSTPCYCYQKEVQGNNKITISNKDETLLQNNFDNEVLPHDIFSFRYF